MTPSAEVGTLEQALLGCAPDEPLERATGDTEEVLFVVSGSGSLTVGALTEPLEPESGVYVTPGARYSLSGALKAVAVTIHDPQPSAPGGTAVRAVVRRLADQESHAATGSREFRIVADPSTGLRSATQFVGYIPVGRAPDHFHTYDEVLYVLDGEGLLHVGGEQRRLRPGSSFGLAARTVHCLENTGDRAMRVVAVFRPAGSPAAAYHPDGTPAHADAPVLEPS